MTMTPLEEYKTKLDQIHALELAGRLDTAEYEAICDTTPALWEKLTTTERAAADDYATELTRSLPSTQKHHCLVCDKPVYQYASKHGCLTDGGWLQVSFGYGSVHDTGPLHLRKDEDCTPDLLLLRCRVAAAVICDACFTAKWRKFRGYPDRAMDRPIYIPPEVPECPSN